MAEHLQLKMTYKAQEAFFTVIQGYLRDGFYVGNERAVEKSRRNELFTQVMKRDVPAARAYVANLLCDVGLYYIFHCSREQGE